MQTGMMINIDDTVTDVQFVASALFRSASAIQPVNPYRGKKQVCLLFRILSDHMVQRRCVCWQVVSDGIQWSLINFSPGCRV